MTTQNDMQSTPFIFSINEPVRLYRSAEPGHVIEREIRFDARYQERSGAYLVRFLNEDTRWHFGRELEVDPAGQPRQMLPEIVE